MNVFPAPAKLNLFLHVLGQRADGYHLLQTVFRLLDVGDTVSIAVTTDGRIACTRPIAGVDEEKDLSLRAAKLLQAATNCPLGADIQVDKRLPMGGGLGGGSSDAATVLLALNRLWKVNLPRQRLLELGLQLGADVPFFVFGHNAWAEGIGEALQAIALAPAYYVVLTPHVHIATATIFASRELTRNTLPITMAAFFKGQGRNDLEPVACQHAPAVASALNWLRQFGDARMTGSGSSIFLECVAESEARRIFAQKPENIAGFVARGIEQHPLYDFAE